MSCSGSTRAHTEIKSEKQRKAFAAAEHLPVRKLTGAAKQIRKGTTSAERERHLHEVEGRKLPEQVVRRGLVRRARGR